MTPYELDAVIERLRSMFRESQEDWVPDEILAEGFKDAMPIIDALQAENARLMQAHIEAGIKAGELTAKLLDAERRLACIGKK